MSELEPRYEELSLKLASLARHQTFIQAESRKGQSALEECSAQLVLLQEEKLSQHVQHGDADGPRDITQSISRGNHSNFKKVSSVSSTIAVNSSLTVVPKVVLDFQENLGDNNRAFVEASPLTLIDSSSDSGKVKLQEVDGYNKPKASVQRLSSRSYALEVNNSSKKRRLEDSPARAAGIIDGPADDTVASLPVIPAGYKHETHSDEEDLKATDLHNLREEIMHLKESLQHAHNRIIDMQPVDTGITETSAVSAYRALTGAIRAWISENLQDSLVDRKLIHSSYIRSQARDFFPLLPESNLANMMNQAMEEVNITAAIMNFLKQQIFETIACGALDIEDNSFIHETYTQFRTLVPQRTIANSRLWWTETMHAVMSKESFAINCVNRLKELTTKLSLILVMFTMKKNADLPAFERSLSTVILQPAMTLAMDLEVSQTEIKLAWSDLSKNKQRRQSLQPRSIHVTEWVDASAHGRIVRPGSDLTNTGYRYIADVVPGLRCTKGSGEKKILFKPQILVERHDGRAINAHDELGADSETSILIQIIAKMEQKALDKKRTEDARRGKERRAL